ncbi:hypothetical protein XANCAGTX0491_008880 [Xanthoria calcicola]
MGISLYVSVGRLQGQYEYLNDNMVHVRLLLANGTTITASAVENENIFWAVRGAGNNIGIALEATFQVYPQRNNGEHYLVDFEYELDFFEDFLELVSSIFRQCLRSSALFVIGRKRGASSWVRQTVFSTFEFARMTGIDAEAHPEPELDLLWPESDAQLFVFSIAATIKSPTGMPYPYVPLLCTKEDAY